MKRKQPKKQPAPTEEAEGTISVRVSSDLQHAARLLAALSKQSIRDVIDDALREYIAAFERKSGYKLPVHLNKN